MCENITRRLTGIWFIGGLPTGEEGILVIMADGRVVQFLKSLRKPRVDEALRLQISAEDGNHVRFRPSRAAAGWLRGVEFDGPRWTMIAKEDGAEHRFPCRHASAVFLPSWFGEMLERNLEMMAAEGARDHG